MNALEQLALGMQSGGARERGRKTRRVQVSRRWAAEEISDQFPARTPSEQIQLAERFLRDEELDSGIIVGRGDDLRFWHLTFQEFLAAQAIAGLTEASQHKILLGAQPRAYEPEWREVALLFAGLLAQQGRPKVDAFVTAVLDTTTKRPMLAVQARCAGLLGAVVRDLAPIEYQINDVRYNRLLDAVLGVFDPRRAADIPIEVRIEAAEALGQAGDPRLEPAHPERWVKVPAGTFAMGAQAQDPNGPSFDAEAYEDESPVHDVSLDAFAIARFPVTVGEFRAFVDDDGYRDAKWWGEGGYGQFQQPDGWDDQMQYPNRPVVGVSWYEAAAFARWSGTRLPTEAEWEKAARGTGGRRFPWGNEPADASKLNYDSNVGRPTPVGLYPAGVTPGGIHDMAGNVWEWCQDWYAKDYYASGPRENPPGPEKGVDRVVRGVSWGLSARVARSACRSRYLPDIRYVDLGFRVVVVGVARTR